MLRQGIGDEQQPTPGPYLSVGLLLSAVGLLASAVPAQRVARANPAAVLRAE